MLEFSKLPELPTTSKTLKDTLHSFIEKKESINNQTMQTLINLTETLSKLTQPLSCMKKISFLLNLNQTLIVNKILK